MTGNPNQKLPEQLPIFVPVETGAVYHWKEPQWSGNSVLSSITLSNEFGLKPGDVANGMQIEAGWDRVREEYGHLGYLDAKIDPVVSYDDQSHTVSYAVSVSEGTCSIISTPWSSRVYPSMPSDILLGKWPMQAGAVFDKAVFEDFLTKLESHHVGDFRRLAAALRHGGALAAHRPWQTTRSMSCSISNSRAFCARTASKTDARGGVYSR